MNLDTALVSAMLREGTGAVKRARERGVQPDWLSQDGKTALEFVFDFVGQFGEVPKPDVLLGKTGVLLDDTPAPAEFYIDEVVNRRLHVSLQDSAAEVIDHLQAHRPHDALQAMEKSVKESRRSLLVQSPVQAMGQLAAEVRELYFRVKNGERGVLTPWPSINEETFGLWPADLFLMVARLGKGKCLDEASLIQDPETGVLRTLREVVEGDQAAVLSWNQSEGVCTAPIAAKVDTGRKVCLEFTLASGRTVVVTPEHPFLTPMGWAPAAELKVGASVGLPAQVPFPRTPQELSDADLDLLTVLLAEGSYTGHHVGFSTADPRILAVVKSAAAVLGTEVCHKQNYDYDLVGGNERGKNAIRELLRGHSLDLTLAKNKTLPDAIFRLPPHQLLRFLALFWMCDGYVDDNGPGLTLASEKMVRQVQHLLLRFGIQSGVKYKAAKLDEKTFDSWRLKVYASCWEAFAALPLWGDKRERLETLLQRDRNPNVGMPRLNDHVVAELRAVADQYAGRWSGGRLKQVGDRLGWESPFMFKSLFGRHGSLLLRRFKVFCEVFDCRKQFGWLYNSGLFWDEVVEVRPAGERKIYDLTVEGTHCFVANDIVVHNTWLAICMAHYAWTAGKHRVLIATTEMAKVKMTQRFCSLHLRLPYDDLRKGRLGAFQEQRFLDGVDELAKSEGLFIAGGDFDFRMENFEAAVEEMQPALVVLDGAYLLRVEGSNRTEQMANAWNELKRLAHRTKIPFFVTTQFNREVKGQNMTKQLLAENIALSDVAGWNADVIYGLFQTDDMKKDKKLGVKPIKLREGAGTDDLMLNWDFDNMDFSEISQQNQQDSGGDFDIGLGSGSSPPSDPGDASGGDF